MRQHEMLVQSKSSGQIYDITNCVTSADWTTQRCDQPGKLTFQALISDSRQMEPGDVVRFSMDGQLQFYGWVFTKADSRWGESDITCYDRLRYLKANASYAFYNQSASDIIRQIAGDLQLTTGSLADTGYQLPSLIEQNKTCFDIIQDAIEQTLLNTSMLYVLYDDGNGLALQQPSSMISDVVLGDLSLLTDYTFTTDIDKDTYNSIKLVKPNTETGRAEVYLSEDSGNIGQWGLLQLYQTVDDSKNEAQVKAQGAAMLEYYNRATRTLKVEALGVSGLRAGQMVLIKSEEIAGGISQYVMIEKASHHYENGIHTMTLDMYEL